MKRKVSVLLIIAVIIAALCIWQKNNIKALFMFFTKDEASVNKIIEENSKALDEKIKEYAPEIPRYFTPEEEEKIASGEMTVEEAVSLILEESSAEENPETVEINEEEETESASSEDEKKDTSVSDEKTSGADSPKEESSGKTDNGGKTVKKEKDGDKVPESKTDNSVSEIIKKYTAQFYALKAYYTGQLGQLETSAKNEYINSRKNGGKGISKTSLAAKYAAKASALQSECDGKVNALLADMKTELKAAGGDLSIVDTIKQMYDAEKAARKAQYMNMLK